VPGDARGADVAAPLDALSRPGELAIKALAALPQMSILVFDREPTPAGACTRTTPPLPPTDRSSARSMTSISASRSRSCAVPDERALMRERSHPSPPRDSTDHRRAPRRLGSWMAGGT
jgi:hypothetical protein